MDDQRVTHIYAEIESYSIELAKDPTVLGPAYLNEVISRCRNYLNRTTAFLLEIARERHATQTALDGQESCFAIEHDELLADDAGVKSLPNITDREAKIRVLLRERVRAISDLKVQLRTLDAIEKAVRTRHSELVRTDGQIKTQRSLIRDEIDTKSFYGDESSSSAGAPRRGGPLGPRSTEFDDEELERLLSTKPKEETPALPAPTPPVAETASAPVVAEAEVEPEAPVPPPVSAAQSLAMAREALAQKPVPAPEPAVPSAEPPSEEDEFSRLIAEAEAAVATEGTAPSEPEPPPAPATVPIPEPASAAPTSAPVAGEAEAIQQFLDDAPSDPPVTAVSKGKKGRGPAKAPPKATTPDIIVPITPSPFSDDDLSDLLKNL
jgi:hypothetical protein